MPCIPAVRSEQRLPSRLARALAGGGVLVLLGVLGVLEPGAAAAARAPEPDPVPERWQLDLEVGQLRVTTVPTREGPRPFFYLTYQVTNNSGEDLLFAPMWELATDDGEMRRSGLGVPRDVTRHLLARFDNPLLNDQLSMLGRLLQGRENAKQGLVIWPAEDLDVDTVQVFAAGFSGEFRSYMVPDPQNPGEMTRFVLRKTRSLTYCTPGELRPLHNQELRLCERPVWIMR